MIIDQSYFLLSYAFLQAMMDCLVSPPQPGDESYDTFIKVSACMKCSSLKNIILSTGLIRYKMLFSCIIASAFIFLLTFSVIVSHIKPRTKLNRNSKKMAVKLSSQNVIFLPEKKRFLCLFIMCTTQTNNGYKNKFLLLCNETNNFFF